ncbi:MAG: nucleotidyltransferase family protein [Gammaproteobacteria bacterium]|nr:nucleotidyltransferase family protein [Gammaproteobacteria bacterium]
MSREPRVVLLAAGGSSRLGRPKQFLRRGGVTLLHTRVALAGRIARQPPLVVTGARGLAVARSARLAGATVVHNPGWRAGMGCSLARGMRTVRPGTAVLIMSVDQYRVDSRDLKALLAAWHRHPWRPAAAAYEDTVGIPAILPAGWRSRLLGLQGDQGAGGMLRRAGRRISRVEMPRAATDVDYPRDWPSRGA